MYICTFISSSRNYSDFNDWYFIMETIYYKLLKYAHKENIMFNTLYLWVVLDCIGVFWYQHINIYYFITASLFATAINIFIMGYLKFNCYSDYVYLFLKNNYLKLDTTKTDLGYQLQYDENIVSISINSSIITKIDSNISIYDIYDVDNNCKDKISKLFNFTK